MRRIPSIRRATVVLAAGLLAGATALPATAAAAVTEPFHADSGDGCPRAATDGTLTWVTDIRMVRVSGSLYDRPAKGVPPGSNQCDADDGYSAVAYFTLYDGTTVADSASERVDNGTVSFGFDLTDRADTSYTFSDTLVVQVCRSPSVVEPPTYCGRAVTYRPVSTGTS